MGVKMVRIAKSWEDLSYAQWSIVKDSDAMYSAYESDLQDAVETIFDEMRDKYAHMFYTLDRDKNGQWNIELEETPIVELEFRPYDYRNKLWYYDEYFKEFDEFPTDKYTFTFKIVDIYPGTQWYVSPKPESFEIEVFPNDLFFDFDRNLAQKVLLEDVLRNTVEGKRVLEQYANYYTEPLMQIDDYESYILGGNGEFAFDEWLSNQLEHNGLRAIFNLDENGNETFVDFEWE